MIILILINLVTLPTALIEIKLNSTETDSTFSTFF